MLVFTVWKNLEIYDYHKIYDYRFQQLYDRVVKEPVPCGKTRQQQPLTTLKLHAGSAVSQDPSAVKPYSSQITVA